LVKPVNPTHFIAAVTTRARRTRQQQGILMRLRSNIYEREREHVALNAHAIVSIADTRGVITYINDTFCQISGYRREELMGKNHRLLKSGIHPDSFYQEMWHTISSGRIWKGEVCNKCKDGSFYWVESTITPFMDAKGKPYQYVSIRTDITALKTQEQALLLAREAADSANEAKSRFLSNMSHELRTPLNAIIGFSQLLEFDDTLSIEQLDNVNEVLKAATHLLSLINDILDMAKIESGNIDLSIDAVFLPNLFQESFSLVSQLAKKQAICISCEGLTPSNCCQIKDVVCNCSNIGINFVMADYLRLKQVLLNLLSNAIKYNKPNGRVALAVDAAARPDYVRITVSDTGYGIAKEEQDQLFTQFNRLSAENSGIEGTGIGLAITKQLVELMDGRIGMTSSEGEGSQFWIELPLAKNIASH